jgi:hypothetical protein
VVCSTCTYLECALKDRHTEYTKSCSGAFRGVTSRLEAYDVVEMERARSELEMHRSVCAYAIVAAAAQRSLEAQRPLAMSAPLTTDH